MAADTTYHPGTLLPPGLRLVPLALLLALIVAVGVKVGDPASNRYGDAPTDHYQLWRQRPADAAAAVHRRPLGRRPALALDIYSWTVAGLYTGFFVIFVAALFSVPAGLHRPAVQNRFAIVVLFCLPFLLIVPALLVRLRFKRRILVALMLLPVLACEIYLAVAVVNSVGQQRDIRLAKVGRARVK